MAETCHQYYIDKSFRKQSKFRRGISNNRQVEVLTVIPSFPGDQVVQDRKYVNYTQLYVDYTQIIRTVYLEYTTSLCGGLP